MMLDVWELFGLSEARTALASGDSARARALMEDALYHGRASVNDCRRLDAEFEEARTEAVVKVAAHLFGPRWIPVSERLPTADEDQEPIPCWGPTLGRRTGWHQGNNDWQFLDGREPHVLVGSDRVTHWMPLPEPPEVER